MKLRKVFAFFAVLVLSLGLLSCASAATVTQSGMVVTLELNKAEYTASSNIEAQLTVTNQSGLPMTSVALVAQELNDYAFAGENALEIPRLDAGETQTLQIVYRPIPNTGDDSNLALWAAMALIAAGVLIAASAVYKRNTRLLSILLCIVLAGSVCLSPFVQAQADSVADEHWAPKANTISLFALRAISAISDPTQTVEIAQSAKVDGKTVTVKATVSFKLPEGSDNLNDGIIDRGDIENLVSNGQITATWGPNGQILTVDGSFADKKIRSISDAVDLLNSASELFGWGFYASANEMTSQTVKDSNGRKMTYYRYAATVSGLKVLGSQIVLAVDENGEMTYLASTYDNAINSVSTHASITESAAVSAATDALLSESGVQSWMAATVRANSAWTESTLKDLLRSQMQADAQLLIYAADDSLPVATVYAVQLTGKTSSSTSDENENALTLPLISQTYYVYANGTQSGQIHSSVTNLHSWSNTTVTNKDLKNKQRTISVQSEGSTYRLKDGTRGIETYKTTFGSWLWENRTPYRLPVIPGELVETSDFLGVNFAKDYVSAHANMAAVYDYYLNKLGRRSFDGNGAIIRVSTRYDDIEKFNSGNYYNAFWTPANQQFVIGDDGNLGAGIDVLGHEFTHAVINYVVGNGREVSLTYSGESGALNESLADIMGNLIEGKTDSGKWKLAEDTDATLRDMSRPSTYHQPEHYDNYVQNGDVHENSGIFNFAAYKMMTDSRTSSISSEKWAEVFYHAMFRLTTDATFLLARGAVIASAKAAGFTGSQQQAIKDAFDAVGIKENSSIRIVLTWGETPSDLDSHLVGPGVNGDRFHVYYVDRSYYEDGSYYSDTGRYAVDLDYDDTTSYGPEVTTIHTLTPGTYYFYVHDYTTYDDPESEVMSLSGARVKIYCNPSSNEPTATYYIRPNEKGTIWNVCQITINSNHGITVTPINTYGNSVTYH